MGTGRLLTLLLVPALVAGCGARGDVTAAPARSASTASAAPAPSTGGTTTAAPDALTATTLIAFATVSPSATEAAAEVSTPDDLARFVGGPTEAVDPARAAVVRYAGRRMFAFVLAGCRNDGATLTIRAARISATLTGGEGVACLVAEYFLAVFAVPPHLVPPGAKVGGPGA